MGHRRPFSFIFVFSNKHHQNTTNTCENVHPVFGAESRTHNLENMSLHPITTRLGLSPLVSISYYEKS